MNIPGIRTILCTKGKIKNNTFEKLQLVYIVEDGWENVQEMYLINYEM